MKNIKYIVMVGEFNALLDCIDWEDYEYNTKEEQLAAAQKWATKSKFVKLLNN